MSRKNRLRLRLTDAAIVGLLRELGATGARITVRDTELIGYLLRISQQRKVTFAYEYRPRGAGRTVSATTLTVGWWPALKADAARKLVQGYAVDVARGSDPAVERRAQRQRLTLAALLAVDGAYERSLRRRQLVNWKVRCRRCGGNCGRCSRPLSAR
jgi:hypothetical protein